MGVRFACHACGKRLNIKTELAGRRGVCPNCSVRFRIPTQDRPTSIPLPASPKTAALANQTADRKQKEPSVSSSSTSASFRPETARPQVAHATAERSMSASRSPTDPQPATADLLGDETSIWYVRPASGGQYGPANGPTMAQWIQEGRVGSQTLVWRDGWPEWRLASDALASLPDSPWTRSQAVAREVSLDDLLPQSISTESHAATTSQNHARIATEPDKSPTPDRPAGNTHRMPMAAAVSETPDQKPRQKPGQKPGQALDQNSARSATVTPTVASSANSEAFSAVARSEQQSGGSTLSAETTSAETRTNRRRRRSKANLAATIALAVLFLGLVAVFVYVVTRQSSL